MDIQGPITITRTQYFITDIFVSYDSWFSLKVKNKTQKDACLKKIENREKLQKIMRKDLLLKYYRVRCQILRTFLGKFFQR